MPCFFYMRQCQVIYVYKFCNIKIIQLCYTVKEHHGIKSQHSQTICSPILGNMNIFFIHFSQKRAHTFLDEQIKLSFFRQDLTCNHGSELWAAVFRFTYMFSFIRLGHHFMAAPFCNDSHIPEDKILFPYFAGCNARSSQHFLQRKNQITTTCEQNSCGQTCSAPTPITRGKLREIDVGSKR